MSAQPLLFEPSELPETAVPVSEASVEWREAQMLKLVEGVRFDPERLAAYTAQYHDGKDFLDHVIRMLGGRSQ